MKSISIYDYTDYRAYLNDYYQAAKKADPKYSHRYFALKMGVKSSGFFSEVINGKRNLSRRNTALLCRALKLSDGDSRYLENLVTFNQAKTQSEKDYWLSRLLVFQKSTQGGIRKDVYEYFSKWYITAIRELLYFYPFDGDYKRLGMALTPTVRPTQVREALKILERLNLIKKRENGTYCQSEAIVSTGDEVKSTEVANFQLQMLELAGQALDTMPAEKRDISTLTLSLSEKGFEKIRSVIKRTRKEILNIAVEDSCEDRVIQINIQMFPLAETGRKY